MAYKEMGVLLGKAQTALGTKQSSLLAADFRSTSDGYALDLNIDTTPIKLATGALGQERSVPGLGSADLKMKEYIAATGSSTAPYVSDYLKAAGHKLVTSTNVHTYTPSSIPDTDWKDMTFWEYTGNKVAASSTLTKVHSVLFDGSIDFEVGKPIELNLTGKGCIDALPAAATFVSGTLTPFSETIGACLKTTTMSVLGVTYKILKGSLKFGNKVELVKDGAQDYGYSRTDILMRESSFTATVYEQVITTSPFGQWQAGTLADFVLTLGLTGSKINIKTGSVGSNKAQITSIKKGDDAGINTWEISGIIIDNDYAIIFNEA